jgi:hypothetical protein
VCGGGASSIAATIPGEAASGGCPCKREETGRRCGARQVADGRPGHSDRAMSMSCV